MGKDYNTLLCNSKEERKVDIDGTFLGKVISCATLMNGCVPFDECGACGSSGSMMEMDDEDTAVSTLTEIRWSDDVVKKLGDISDTRYGGCGSFEVGLPYRV